MSIHNLLSYFTIKASHLRPLGLICVRGGQERHFCAKIRCFLGVNLSFVTGKWANLHDISRTAEGMDMRFMSLDAAGQALKSTF